LRWDFLSFFAQREAQFRYIADGHDFRLMEDSMATLEQMRLQSQLKVNAQAKAIEAILKAHLDEETWKQIQEKWMGKPAVQSAWPEQRRDFLIEQAEEHDLLMQIPLAVFGSKVQGR